MIVYQGTDPRDIKDILTDISLAGSSIPQQLKDAQHYYETMKEKYGIQYVCGNSLGGALANHVAVNNKDIQSLTYNPAIIPGNIEGEANNIRNYLGKYDSLTILQLGVGYHEKISGQHNTPVITQLFNFAISPACFLNIGYLVSNFIGLLDSLEDSYYAIKNLTIPSLFKDVGTILVID